MFRFTAGETIAFALKNLDGAVVDAVASQIKAAGPFAAPQGPPLATCVVTASDDLGQGAPGWIFTAPGDLPPGAYLADARLTAGDRVVYTDVVSIVVTAAVTEADS